MKQRPVRAAAANADAGDLVLLHDRPDGGRRRPDRVAAQRVSLSSARPLLIAVVGIVMVALRTGRRDEGHHPVQIIKAVLLLLCVTLMSVFLLGKFGFSLSAIMEARPPRTTKLGAAVLAPRREVRLQHDVQTGLRLVGTVPGPRASRRCHTC